MIEEGEHTQNSVKGKKIVPSLFGKDATYKIWRNKLYTQKIVSGVPKNEQGITVLLESIRQ